MEAEERAEPERRSAHDEHHGLPIAPQDMEVCEQNEAWVENDKDFGFSHTKIILRQDGQYFYAISTRRYRSTTDVNLRDLEPIPIPASQIWPQFPDHFTRAPKPLPEHYYIKRPSLICYGDTEASTDLADIVLREAGVCEILRASPHPYIAQYLGCIEEKNKITGLCFHKYDMNLSQWVTEVAWPFDAGFLLQCIEEGIRHLHGLGYIHCDLNPTNIFMAGDIPVIGDFDSCRKQGDKLGLKAGTYGWTSDDFRFAMPENDYYGLSKIRDFLISKKQS